MWEDLQVLGVTVPAWLFWTTLAIIVGVTAWETYLNWERLALDGVSAQFLNGPFWKKLWLAASLKSFQPTAVFTLLWLPFGLAIQKEVVMRFLNRDATIESAREAGLMEGHTKGHAEGHTEGHAEGRAEGRAEGQAEGRAEGQAETNRAWAAWNQRREAAAERNEPFNEPPPDQAQG